MYGPLAFGQIIFHSYFFFINIQFSSPTNYLHYLQWHAITGFTCSNTIYITYLTKQYDYLLNLQYQFIHYLQNYTITYATHIHTITMNN